MRPKVCPLCGKVFGKRGRVKRPICWRCHQDVARFTGLPIRRLKAKLERSRIHHKQLMWALGEMEGLPCE